MSDRVAAITRLDDMDSGAVLSGDTKANNLTKVIFHEYVVMMVPEYDAHLVREEIVTGSVDDILVYECQLETKSSGECVKGGHRAGGIPRDTLLRRDTVAEVTADDGIVASTVSRKVTSRQD